MPTAVAKARPAWENRFHEPEIEFLLSQYETPTDTIVQSLRDRLAALGGVKEQLAWHGIPWRWTIAYRHPSAPEPALAYLVPHPSRPAIAVPVPSGSVSAASARRLARSVRDAIVHAPYVNGVAWPQWDLVSRQVSDEALALIELRLESLVAKA